MSKVYVTTLLLSLCIPVPTRGQTRDTSIPDTWLGVWQLDFERTRAGGNMTARPSTSTLSRTPEGLKTSIRSVDAEGKPTLVEVTAKLDGTRVSQTGTAGSRSYRKIDQHTYEYDQFNAAGEKTTTVRAVMSPDGKSRTVTQRAANASSDDATGTSYWVKQ